MSRAAEGYTAQFIGSGIELAIAKWYYGRGFQVFNIDQPGWEDAPWFAHVMISDPNEGKYIWRPVGVVRVDLPGGEAVLAKHKYRAEHDDGGLKGEMWVVTGVTDKEYECELHQLMPPGPGKRWRVVRDKITLKAEE